MGDHHDDRDAINGDNTIYLAELHARWQDDPASVDPAFAALFATLGAEKSSPPTEDSSAEALKNAYRLRGHSLARLDPLDIAPRPDIPELTPPDGDRDLLARLRRAYCGTIAAEFMHLQDTAQRQWWINRLEEGPLPSPMEPRRILQALTRAEGFEAFCQKRFMGMRRFGLEGGESVIVALRVLIDAAAREDVRSVSLGMPHRGRLNVMANILRKPFAAIFSEFAGASFKPDNIQGSGDVKYHLGTATTLEHAGRTMRVSLLPNPSHLEAVDPVVLGRVRADQDREKDRNRNRHLGILVHGDAAFAGQGVVYESLSLSRLEGYRTGGTVHVIINNQIGFTTVQSDAHSGVHNTDIAKAIQAPVLHVNGDDPDAVASCALLAHEWRATFQSDIVLDIVCYRRHGHNEADEPAFTQPAMVRAIQNRPTTRRLYADRLIKAGILSEQDVETMWQHFQKKLEDQFAASTDYHPDATDWLDGPQDPTRLQDEPERIQPMTGVPLARLRAVGEAIGTIPDGLAVHPRLARQIMARGKAVADGGPLGWATAEALAFGTLSMDGHPVRLSGQDSRRGTFSQRHAVLFDQETSREDTPLMHIAPHQAPLNIWNSPLSEYAVLGFEYGYSLGDPDALVLWEAQFGDFTNGAQIILDQFVASGETKWLRTSNLTLLLPHGYEGGGPEHSSARIERILQLCAENNMRVCNITSPANYFHALRRQIARRCRKPLVVFTPKSLLRNRDAVSMLDEMGPHTRFRPVLPDPEKTEDARKVILCSGKVYYDLAAERTRRNLKDVAIIRLEQLYPFPHHGLMEQLSRHRNAEQVLWCQEEPENNGPWIFVDRRIERALRESGHRVQRPVYVGRESAASPATGLPGTHAAQQGKLVQDALS
ncbi:2-oxoglutarate dehydrogenase E1 component [Gluconobacter morbifer]|uniref:2-oxoglutarate dehydrogenase E1 component n=1 Tax=Gluconobacter morbifer G707 TaxID=1088869 RepID=G6XK32_9PROT|nr:2-oxoglutarate dehydrogenase E1 component [Gluconobacter morbifer]EHH67994.1 2-oxoglutarate dehydrogenase E1 component [Gluconobacter morbifer G707]